MPAGGLERGAKAWCCTVNGGVVQEVVCVELTEVNPAMTQFFRLCFSSSFHRSSFLFFSVPGSLFSPIFHSVRIPLFLIFF